MTQEDLVRRWTGPTGQTDWTRVVQEGGRAPAGIPIGWDVLQREGWELDGLAAMRMYLESLGLGDLGDWARDMLVTGASPEQITLELRQQPSYRRRFAAIFDREAAGLSPISAADVLNYESQARQVMREAGLPEGFYDSPDDFRKWIGGDVSLRELSFRVQDGYLAAERAPQDVKNELSRLYGIGPGGYAAWALDEKRALPTLERQIQAAVIGGAGAPRGFTLSREKLEELAAMGIDRSRALSGFANLQSMQPLFSVLPGEQGQAIGQEQQLAAQFGNDVAAQQAIERRQRERQSPFEGSGAYAAGSRGISGLGTASR